MIDCKPIILDVNNKWRNLDICSKGIVKGTKYFPVFLIDGEEYIFKPISKTKPYATTLFSYAEVYWSYVINRFFDDKTPVCKLAYCYGLEKEQPKYFDKGVLVKSTINSNQKLINLLEYYEMYPDKKVDISNYINYCMVTYSYVDILNSDFVKNNPLIGDELAFQILLSILRQDYNYHYENVNFIVQDGNIVGVNPPIDFEFSSMFCFPEDDFSQKMYFEEYLSFLNLHNSAQIAIAKFFNNPLLLKNECLENISKIVLEYPQVIKRFLQCLDKFMESVDSINLSDESDFIGKVDSNSWEIGHYTFKEQDSDKLKEAYDKVKPREIDKIETFARIKRQVKENACVLRRIIDIYLYVVNHGVTNLLDFTLEDLISLKASEGEEVAIDLKRSLGKLL